MAWYSCISGLVAYVATINQHIGDEMRYVLIEHDALLDSQCFGQVMHAAGPDVCFQFDSTFGYPGEGPIVVDNGMDFKNNKENEEIAFHVDVDGNLVDRCVCKKCGQQHDRLGRAAKCTCKRFCKEL